MLFAAALLLPVLAGVGFVAMGRELEVRRSEYADSAEATGGGADARLHEARAGALLVYFALVAFIAVGRTWRRVAERRARSVVWIAYPGANSERAARLDGPRGEPQLRHPARGDVRRARAVHDVSRAVRRGQSQCPVPAADEPRALAGIVSANPDIRLACQLRPTGDIAVEPLVSVAGSASLVHRSAAGRWASTTPRSFSSTFESMLAAGRRAPRRTTPSTVSAACSRSSRAREPRRGSNPQAFDVELAAGLSRRGRSGLGRGPRARGRRADRRRQ